MTEAGLRDIVLNTRIAIFPYELGAECFASTAEISREDGAISQGERAP